MMYNKIKVGVYMKYEVRTLIKEENLENIINFFEQNATKKELENQVIYNYHTENEFRLIRTKNYAELNLRTNSKEDTVYIGKKYEKDLIDMFKNIGISVDFKRFRSRYKYIYESFYITVDKNIKTGNILRASFNYNDESDKQNKLNQIEDLYKKLNIEQTSLERFEEMYGKYRHSWNDLIKDIDEEEFLK